MNDGEKSYPCLCRIVQTESDLIKYCVLRIGNVAVDFEHFDKTGKTVWYCPYNGCKRKFVFDK